MKRLGRRRLARPRARARDAAARARAAGRRARRRREPARLGAWRASRAARACSRTSARVASRRTSTSASRRRAASGCCREPGRGARARRGRGARRRSRTTRARCGIAGPRIAVARRHVATDAAALPDGARHARPPDAAAAALPAARAPARALPASTRTSDEPVEADWLLGAFLLMRRAMLDELGGWDEGFRHYVEDIDLCYRAMRAGWERWYVPAARSSRTTGRGDRPALPLAAHALACAQHGALRPQAPRDARARCERATKAEQYARKAAGWSDAEYADARAYLAHRAELVAVARRRARAGRRGARPRLRRRRPRRAPARARPALPRRRLEPAMVDGGAARVSATRADDRAGGPRTTTRPPSRSRRRRSSARSTTPTTAPRSSVGSPAFTERKLVFDLNPRQYPCRDVVARLERPGSPASSCGRSSSRRRSGSGAGDRRS